MKPHTIGVLAGMGPRSTAPFVDQLVSECQRQYGAQDDEDFPPILIYSLPTPFYVDRPIDHERMQSVVTDGLRRLESAGVDFIVMPCNSAHQYFDALTRAIGVPLLNMVDEASRDIPDSASRVALIGTRPTVDAGLYQHAVKRRGPRLIHDSAIQTRVDELIMSIKTSRDMRAAQALWNELQLDVMSKGADTFLIACTDLDAIELETAATVVDATHSLATAAVRTWLERGRS